MLHEICAYDTRSMTLDVGKHYPRHQPRKVVEEDEVAAPPGWVTYDPESDYTITLFAFAWALLPVGFMVMMLVFDRFAQYRLALAGAALGMLCLAFATGATQRKGALKDERVLLAIAALCATVALTLLVWRLNLNDWWWAVYGMVFGCVPMMYVAIDHLAKCTALGFSRPWSPERTVPSMALPGWRIQTARWANGPMASVVTKDGVVGVLYGELADGETRLCFESLQPKSEEFPSPLLNVDWRRFDDETSVATSEE